MTVITRETIAKKLVAHLQHGLPLDSLVAWTESALMDREFDPTYLPTIRDVVAMIGIADFRAFGLTWEDCEQLLVKLGYSNQINIVAR